MGSTNAGDGDPVLGTSWRHTYSRRISVAEFFTPVAVAIRADGKEWRYLLAADGSWSSESGGDVSARLVELTDGVTRSGWALQDFAADTVELYDANGRLERITQASGA